MGDQDHGFSISTNLRIQGGARLFTALFAVGALGALGLIAYFTGASPEQVGQWITAFFGGSLVGWQVRSSTDGNARQERTPPLASGAEGEADTSRRQDQGGAS